MRRLAQDAPRAPARTALLGRSARREPNEPLRSRTKARRKGRGQESGQGLGVKKVSKEFGKKFATGSSVTKVPGGGEEITVQGDLSDEIEEYVLETYKIPEDNVELVEDKKKGKGG